MGKETAFALAVSLLTWGGVWAYMLRLDLLTRSLQRATRELEAREGDPRPFEPAREEVGL